MDQMVIPAFHRWPNEASVLGKLLVAFGELEYMTCKIAGTANGNLDPVLKALYRLRSVSSRIEAADAFMRPVFATAGFEGDYGQMLGALKYCLRIRNQFAHCHWGDHEWSGLFFVDLEESAEKSSAGWDHDWLHVDYDLLNLHYAFFYYAKSWLFFFEYQIAQIRGTLTSPLFPKPKALERPPLHNPRSQHIPAWLDADQKAQHLARALESEQSAPQSERPPSVLRLTKEEWAAKDAKDAREASQPPE
jgi:hypothetical protein